MATDRWDMASVEEKLQLLRRDIIDIAAVQNALAREFRDLAHQLTMVAEGVEALSKNRPPISTG